MSIRTSVHPVQKIFFFSGKKDSFEKSPFFEFLAIEFNGRRVFLKFQALDLKSQSE